MEKRTQKFIEALFFKFSHTHTSTQNRTNIRKSFTNPLADWRDMLVGIVWTLWRQPISSQYFYPRTSPTQYR